MDSTYSPRTDQRAGVRPISFVLDSVTGGGLSASSQVTLPIRPEDLTRNEPTRATVHQTLGRGTQGWVDNFGEGLPSVTISGHTGWGYKPGIGKDGFESFEALNDLVQHRYPAEKQAAINAGLDPARVKLLFVDLLDNFAWSVVPTQFVLRRSKSRALFYQYNISLQAVDTSVDGGLGQFLPNFGGITAGLAALDGAISALTGFASSVEGWVSGALAYVDRGLAPIATLARQFMSSTTQIFGQVSRAVGAANNGIFGTANRLILIARDMAKSGVNIFRTFAAIGSIPSALKASLSRVASAYNEVLCIFGNSLRPRSTYDNYDGLYGASNCSSTTGGRSASAYGTSNAFALMQPDRTGASLSSSAISGLSAIGRSDPVLSPMPVSEVGRHLGNIVSGVTL